MFKGSITLFYAVSLCPQKYERSIKKCSLLVTSNCIPAILSICGADDAWVTVREEENENNGGSFNSTEKYGILWENGLINATGLFMATKQQRMI